MVRPFCGSCPDCWEAARALAGTPTLPSPRPAPVTYEKYLVHVTKFGADGVYETAAEEGLAPKQLERLRIELDAIERGRKSKSGFTVGRARRRTSEETAEAVHQLRDEGLLPAVIAEKLGVSKGYVGKLLAASNGVSPKHAARRLKFGSTIGQFSH